MRHETKRVISIKVEFNPQKNISLHQDGSRFFVYSSNISAVTSSEHTPLLHCLVCSQNCVYRQLQFLKRYCQCVYLLSKCSLLFRLVSRIPLFSGHGLATLLLSLPPRRKQHHGKASPKVTCLSPLCHLHRYVKTYDLSHDN